MAQLDQNGHEVLSDKPVAQTFKVRQRSYFDHVRDYIRQELSRQSADTGHETFEEADDFDVGDDYDPRSPYEVHFDPSLEGQTPFQQEEPTPPAPSGEGGETKPDSGAVGA